MLSRKRSQILQKVNRLQPDQAAILYQLLGNARAGTVLEDAKNQIELMQLGLQKREGEGRLTLGRERIASQERTNLANIKSTEDIATRRMETDKSTSLADIAQRASELDFRAQQARDELSDKKKAYPWELGLGAAGTAIEGLTSYKKYQDDQELKKMKKEELDLIKQGNAKKQWWEEPK